MNKGLSLIFDLDGCLIDSSMVQKEALMGSYKEVVGDDKCPSYEEYIKHTGDSIENVLKKLGLPIAMAGPFRKISNSLIDRIEVKWDAISLIRIVKNAGIKTAICTGKDHDRTEEILQYFSISDCFDVLVCADDVTEPKPSSMPILKAVEMLESDLEDTYMVGDGYNDILAARNAHIRSILTLWYGDARVPRESDYVVESVDELKVLLEELNEKEFR